MSDALLTTEYVTEGGTRRRVRFERVDDAPWRIERHVDRPDGDGGWEPVGGAPLRMCRINGEHRGAKTVTALSHDGGERR